MMRLGLQNTYSALPSRFYARVAPAPVKNPQLVVLNSRLAEELDFDPAVLEHEGAAWFSGNQTPDDADPIALAYAGHQFGGFVPQLGDGRAILLGERVGRDGVRRDIQLKGSGRTPFSRNGDGRAALGRMLREYLISEAMHALGVPTTRSLAVITTGERVVREGLQPGAVLTRVAASHIRVGTFEYFAARNDRDAVSQLLDYVITRHDRQARGADVPALAVLEAVAIRQAALIASWMHVGFIHGVMNTDNMAISGETIDYGPCAFMDHYDPATVFSSIDHRGRYCYANQPMIAQWNLARLAETLLPLIDSDNERAIARATEVLNRFPEIYERRWLEGMRAKLGLVREEAGDVDLANGFLSVMHHNHVDWTKAFRFLSEAASDSKAPMRDLFADPSSYDPWNDQWRSRLSLESVSPSDRAKAMRQVNPVFIPRNHRVEEALSAAVERSDYAPFERLLQILARPFTDQTESVAFAEPAPEDQPHYRTFCGT